MPGRGRYLHRLYSVQPQMRQTPGWFTWRGVVVVASLGVRLFARRFFIQSFAAPTLAIIVSCLSQTGT